LSADPERAIEDLFNQEIFGVDTSNPDTLEPEPPIEMTPIPEPKSVGEAIQAAEDGQEEETPEPEVEGTPLIELDLEDDGEVIVLDEVEEEEEYVSWAKKQFGDDVDLENASARKLAKSAFEKEKMLGKKAEEANQLKAERDRQELQAKIDALQTPGNVTPEEDAWIDEAVSSGDPGEWAYNALQAERPDLYAAIINRWASMGEGEAAQARRLDAAIIQAISQPQPSKEESYSMALGQTFQSLGLDIETQGPIILAKAEELGASHPSVVAMMSPDPTIRQLGTRNVFDLAVAGKTTVRKAVLDDDVQARVKEETLRQQAAGVTTGKPHVEAPKKSAFWEGFDEELKERGWDGNGPTYGRD
jgi:hypothetical protein